VFRRDTARAERLTSVPGGVEAFAWSPDSKQVAFIARDQATPQERARQSAGDDATEVDRNFKYSRLWIANLLDHNAVQITKQDFEINELHGLRRATKSPSLSPGRKSLKTRCCFPW
jgi:dipeptidyl aminopeptidase/acylaminoacyl peptidase